MTGNFADRQLNAYFYDVQPEFATPDRPAYQARAGYQGTDLFAGVIVPLTKYLRVFTGGQFLLHTGSTNSASPLYKKERELLGCRRGDLDLLPLEETRRCSGLTARRL